MAPSLLGTPWLPEPHSHRVAPPSPLLLPPLTQLTARVPHLLGAVVGRVHPQPQRVDTGQMAGIVPDEAVPWGRGGVGLWWPLGYHSLTGCQSLSATLPSPDHLQRPAGNRQNSHCQLMLCRIQSVL